MLKYLFKTRLYIKLLKYLVFIRLCFAPAFSFQPGDGEAPWRLWHEQWADAGRPDHPPSACPTPVLHCQLYLNGRRNFRFRVWKELQEERKLHEELETDDTDLSKIKIFYINFNNFAYECFKTAEITAENANNRTISWLERWAMSSKNLPWMPSYKDLLVNVGVYTMPV